MVKDSILYFLRFMPDQYLETFVVVWVVWVHFIADFYCQSDWMARGKSKKFLPLAAHIFVYSLFFFFSFGWKYALINGGLHMATDFVTSRISSRFWAKGKVHEFFVTIGFDQAFHMTCLYCTLRWATPGWLF